MLISRWISAGLVGGLVLISAGLVGGLVLIAGVV